ncbi:integrase, catalytic region, zinc finger, CCHC-type containing protein [Tanacetum coccineum]|uniref:Integrase, catalytic region, zinc finger, CCHC-type containing protein n=1 Tax=Tanacetum coccineum TaxID=301880 RepID=A0ABQ4WV10_9ASTR
MKGSDIGAQEKKAKLFKEWEKFNSTEVKPIKSYYHRFAKLMNDFFTNKHFPEKIVSNLKFLNHLQPEWKRHVTTVYQTKNLYEVDYNQLYDFLKMNQEEVNEIRAERLAKTHDPLALMAKSHNPYNYLIDTDVKNARNQVVQNAVQKLGNQNVGNQNRLIVVLGITNQNANQNGDGNVVAARAEGNGDIDEIEEVNANCILMANLQQASTSGTQTDKAPIYDSDGSAEGLGHNLFSVRQFCDSDIEVAFRQNTCFVKNLKGVDLLKGNRTTNLYTINLHEMTSASPICLMDHVISTKSWLCGQRLSHLNFDTINDLAKNNLITGLPKCKYYKEHLCPSCEQGKSKKSLHKPKLVPNSEQRLHLLHMDLCGPMRFESINGKRYILVIVDDYSPIAIACYTQNRSLIHQRLDKTSYELINNRKPDISFLHVFGALCYPKNDRKDIGKLGAKCDIGFFIGYSATSCAYRVYNRRTRKIMETMNATFDEISAMDFEQRSSNPELEGMTSRHISSGLELTYAPSTISSQKPTKCELDLLFEAMYDDYCRSQSE